MGVYTFQGNVDKLEVARGYDGLLGGSPKPVVAVGIYAACGADVRLLGRSLHRFFPRKPFPSETKTNSSQLPGSTFQIERSFCYVAVAIALEEDGGEDVSRMFGALERHEEMTLFAAKHAEVDPIPLASVGSKWTAPCAVELCIDGTPAGTTCRSDKWVGAVCWAMPPRPGTPVSIYRLPFLAPDQRNDWTALVSIGH